MKPWRTKIRLWSPLGGRRGFAGACRTVVVHSRLASPRRRWNLCTKECEQARNTDALLHTAKHLATVFPDFNPNTMAPAMPALFVFLTLVAAAAAGAGEPSSSSMLLITNGHLYTPRPLGKAHILTGGGSILAILPEEYPVSNLTGGLALQIVDAQGGLVVPGLVDMHVHVTGGGGEMGPASRTPEATVDALLDAGITTVVGILGTDCVSRSLENLRVKVAALQQQGITAHMWSGCYRVPSPTLTGSLIRDLQLIEEVIGAGEIAISDHRSSWPTTQELMGLVTDARVGGMLSGKAGIVHFHTGSAASLLQPLWDVVNASHGTIPLTHMIPTHVSGRGPALLKAAAEWVSKGGRVDFTADQEGETASHDALMSWRNDIGNVAIQGVSLSSDAFGSLPKFDSKGLLVEYAVASPKANLNTIRRLVHEGKWALEDALQLSTVNPASFLSFASKGKLEVGADADMLILNSQSLEVEYVVARGKLLKSPKSATTNVAKQEYHAPTHKNPLCIEDGATMQEPLKEWKQALQHNDIS